MGAEEGVDGAGEGDGETRVVGGGDVGGAGAAGVGATSACENRNTSISLTAENKEMEVRDWSNKSLPRRGCQHRNSNFQELTRKSRQAFNEIIVEYTYSDMPTNPAGVYAEISCVWKSDILLRILAAVVSFSISA